MRGSVPTSTRRSHIWLGATSRTRSFHEASHKITDHPPLSEPRQMRRIPLFFIVNVLVILGAHVFQPQSGYANEAGASALSVTSHDGRTFDLARGGAPELRLRFLSPTIFRLRVAPLEKASLRANYIRVKSDSAYPPPAVKVLSGPNEVAFSTSTTVVRVVVRGKALSVSVSAGERKLIDGWT